MVASDLDCPYGANDCPKICQLKDMISSNTLDINEINKNVVAINTTLKNVSYLLTAVITIICALIGVLLI